MVVTAPANQHLPKGLRPINLNRDIPQVLRLLELCFGASIRMDGQRLLSANQSQDGAPFLWRISPAASKLALGYVWEANGRIVGNVTVLTTKTPHRYLVVNVAVHPEQRRKGIARLMMQAVADMVKQRNGHEILLQVVKTNTPAIHLYRTLQYDELGSMSSWEATYSRLHRIAPSDLPPTVGDIRELKRSDGQAALLLDRNALHPDLNWPEPPEMQQFSPGLWQRVGNFFNGRQQETWAVYNASSAPVALGRIESEWGRSHNISVRVHPNWQGQLERPLLAKLIRRLHYLPRRNVRITHADDDELMNQLLQEANFQVRRTLTHMKLTLP